MKTYLVHTQRILLLSVLLVAPPTVLAVQAAQDGVLKGATVMAATKPGMPWHPGQSRIR